MSVDLAQVETIIHKHGRERGGLIPLLQDVQAAYGYVPSESIGLIARELSVFPVEIFGILTFYSQFYLSPRGKHIVRVCQGTACHVMGGKEILDYFSSRLGIADGETTDDGLFSLERVACLGCCGMAPVVAVGDEFYGGVTVQDADKLIAKYRAGEGK
ncbi:MAG: NADH-quinone oxidoreductase subunit NuoE [Phycisphaerae bacterium]|nr:NADH-quinone oxidoreductase subunit NuoE [Phycisphaerae bacterium]